ncbi:MAG: hypothetical protein JSU70_12110 [Phycisphaerales bacterium]|nr:MAG: hypothetical protein JSU70_12110 [Phycisphaerales bacterium]
MNTKATKYQMKLLREQLKAAKRASYSRLIKLTVVLLIIAGIAAYMQNRIQLW